MASVITLLLLPFAVVLLSAVVARYFRRPHNAPPGPKGWPIIGNAFLMAGENLYIKLTEYSKVYGEVYSLRLGPKFFIVLNTSDVAKEALVDKASHFSKRPMPAALRYVVGQEGSLAFSDGPVWKEKRKFVLSAFRDFGVGKKGLEERINHEAGFVLDVIEKANGEPINLLSVINNAVSNIICSLSFGERFDYDDKRFNELLRKLRENITSLTLGGIIQVFPFLMETPVYGHWKRNFQSLIAFVQGLTKEHSDTFNGNDIRDILDKYLLEIQRQEDGGEETTFKRSDDWRLVFELFLAGTETTTSALLFVILLLTYYQDVQQKIFDEINEVVGARCPQLSDRPNMPYTEAAILEVLRQRPSAPLGVPRLVSEDTHVRGYFIPKGAGVLLNAFAINHDPNIWDRPHEFDPTRFLSPDGKKVIKGDTLMTFGTGRRACAGENLSRMELFFFVARIFQRFHFRFSQSKTKEDLVGTQGIALKPPTFEICAETLTEYSKTYGGIYSLRLGPKLLIVLNTLEVAKEAFVDKSSDFSKRFMPPAIRYVIGQEGSLIFGDGPVWKEKRKFVLSAFRDFGVGKKSLEERVNQEAGHVLEVIEKANGSPLDLHFVINNAVSNIICSLSFGERFDYEDKRFNELLRKLHQNISTISLGGIVHVFPFLMETPLYGYWKKNFQSLMKFIKDLTKDHSETFNGNDIRDILDKYHLELQRQEDSGEQITLKRCEDSRLIFELFLAGTDTTTNTLLFTILFVTHYQDVQQKIFDEISEVVGERCPQLSDRPNMPYTEATILEVLRQRPAAPLGVPRLVNEDTHVGGYFIPKGTGVFLNAFAINHDPKVWDRPYEFDPTRFLSPDGKKVIKGDTLMTFGTGRRACAGETLSRMELFFFVARIVQRFHLRFPANSSSPDLVGTQGISLKPLPFQICADVRR